MICNCGISIELERLDLNLTNCSVCAHELDDGKRPRGRMVYSHKTGAEIEILSHDSWEENKKYFIANGARSCVKNFSKNIA
jgi:hypothetical protein